MKRGARGNPERLSSNPSPPGGRDNLVAVTPTAIFGDALLDPASGDIVRDAVVLIENDHVTGRGARSTFQVPSNAKFVYAEGLLLLLGLVSWPLHLWMPDPTSE